MSVIISILLGVLQGLTEFLPVSSSGHLVLAQHFLNVQESGDLAFEVFLHLGTLLAVVIYFRSLIIDLTASLFRWRNSADNQTARHNRMFIVYVILATLGTGGVYFLLGDAFEAMYSQPLLVAVMLSVTGLIIFLSDMVKNDPIPASSMGIVRSVIIGIAQGFAIIPGISRSGTTIGVSLFAGIKRKDAAAFSFLLSIPAILAANLKEFSSLKALQPTMLFTYFLGFLASFIVGYLVISILIRLIQNSKLKYFSYYCWLISLVSVILILS